MFDNEISEFDSLQIHVLTFSLIDHATCTLYLHENEIVLYQKFENEVMKEFCINNDEVSEPILICLFIKLSLILSCLVIKPGRWKIVWHVA